MSRPEPPEQRHTLRVLVAAQVCSGAGLAAGVTVGALLVEEMLGTTSLAGLSAVLFTAGSALAAVAVGRVSDRHGRRIGLALGYSAGALGSLGVVVAAALESVPVLLLSLLVYGSGMATNLQARYAGADLASPDRRGRATSTVLFATTAGAVVGPNLVGPMGDVAGALDIPRLAGPFILAGFAYGAAGLVLAARLRPDPLLLARSLADRQASDDLDHRADHGLDHRAGPVPAVAAAESPAGRSAARAVPAPPVATSPVVPGAPADRDDRGVPSAPGVAVGAAVMVTTQLVMVAIMTMTPIHMKQHGHAVSATGVVIAAHIAGMYLPSPLAGVLADRFGRRFLAVASGGALALAGLLAAVVPVGSVVGLSVALAMLGVGWNFGLVAGTAILTDAVPLATRARTQGTVDVGIALAGAGGGLGSGFVVASSSYGTLAVVGGVLAIAIIPAAALPARRPADGTPAR